MQSAVDRGYVIIDCTYGDVFTITGNGGNASRAWAFIDANNTLLSVANNSVQLKNEQLYAPDNANKLIVNLFYDSDPFICKGKLLQNQITEELSKLNEYTSEVITSPILNSWGYSIINGNTMTGDYTPGGNRPSVVIFLNARPAGWHLGTKERICISVKSSVLFTKYTLFGWKAYAIGGAPRQVSGLNFTYSTIDKNDGLTTLFDITDGINKFSEYTDAPYIAIIVQPTYSDYSHIELSDIKIIKYQNADLPVEKVYNNIKAISRPLNSLVVLAEAKDMDPNGAAIYDPDTNKITQNYSGSDNYWWNLELNNTIAVSNYLHIHFIIESITGHVVTYLMNKRNTQFKKYSDITYPGTYDYYINILDYDNLDFSKPIYFSFANYYNELSCVYKDVVVYSCINSSTLDVANNIFENLENVNILNITIDNPKCLINYSGDSSYYRKHENIIEFNYTGSGNHWFTYDLDTSSLENNFIRIHFNISNISGEFRLYMFAKRANGNNFWPVLKEIQENGDYSIDIDLNYYVIYESLDLNSLIQFGIANKSASASCTITGFNGTNIVSALNEALPFYENINNMLTDIESNKNGITQLNSNKYLIAPNGSKYITSVDNNGSIIAIPIIPNKGLFVGNSLLLGNRTFGMAASNNTKDYFYYVTEKIKESNPSASFTKLLGSNFEANTSISGARSWLTETLTPELSNDLDIIIVQLGDNVNTEDKMNTFETSCGEMIQFLRDNAPKARIVWVGEWYSNSRRQNIIATSCAKYGAEFIDISMLYLKDNQSYLGAVIDYGNEITRTYAFDTYSDDSSAHTLTVNFTVNGTQYSSTVPYNSYSVNENNITIVGNYGFINSTGVASHPSDTGFRLIADKIISGIGF